MAFTNEYELAKHYGYDITMPEGNMGLPGAAHKVYVEQCQGIYKEFMSNMAVHIKNEKEVKKVFYNLHKEKMKNLRFSMYLCEDDENANDPFAKQAEIMSVSTVGDSRTATPWGLSRIPDENEETNIRPQTAPAAGARKTLVLETVRPKTAGVALGQTDADDVSDMGVSDLSNTSMVVGVIDPKTERTSDRKITVGQRAFAKLQLGNMSAKLKHKEGNFKLMPVKEEFSKQSKAPPVLKAYNPYRAEKNYNPVHESVAMVRQITSYMTPTIASDMKINNRVPIQKSLRGEDAKRTTVSEIYRNARDRKTRHFTIVTRSPAKRAKTTIDQCMQNQTKKDTENKIISVEIRPVSRTGNSRSAMNASESADTVQQANLSLNTNSESVRRLATSPCQYDVTDCSNSANGMALRSILYQSGREEHIRNNDSDYHLGRNEHKTNYDCPRRPTSRVAFATSEAQLPARTESRMSMASMISTASLRGLKRVTDREKLELGFTASSRLDSQAAMAMIVKQQRQKDAQLNDQMSVWRRRMVASGSKSGRGPGGKRGGRRLRLV